MKYRLLAYRDLKLEAFAAPFIMPIQLTDEEKKLTESYNLDDLKQTLYNFKMFYNQFKLRIQIIKKFNTTKKFYANRSHIIQPSFVDKKHIRYF